MEVVQLMALLLAHINFQIRHGFRSRIFFGLNFEVSLLKLVLESLTGQDTQYYHHYALIQSVCCKAQVTLHQTRNQSDTCL